MANQKNTKDFYKTDFIRYAKKIAWNTIGKNNTRYLHSFFPSKPEKELIKRRHDFYMQFLKKGDTYFDVGANYGNRIEPIINEGLNIVAVEPQQECLGYLRLKLGKKIHIVPKGLGEKVEEKTMHIAKDANTKSSFSNEWIDATKNSGRFEDCEWDEERSIEMSTLDILIKEYGKPAFIKIDVEGFELEVLKGLNQPIKMISVEYTVPEQTDRLLECMKRVSEISDGKISCNYSVGESMEWAKEKWMPITAALEFVQTPEFINDHFGDLYLKYEG